MGLQRPFGSNAPSPQPSATPEETVKALYSNDVFFHLRNSFPKEITDYLSPCFTKSLLAHFDSSRTRIEKWLQDNKETDQKLPLGEGPVFIGNYEGAEGFRIGAAVAKGDSAEVVVHMTYTEASTKVEWTDVAILERVSGNWLLSDIKFHAGDGAESTLRDRTLIDVK